MKTFFLFFSASINCLLQALRTNIYTYKTVGNLTIDALVISPTLPAGQLSPVYFAIHLGAFMLESKETGFTPRQRDEILSRGWTIVSIDYRLAPAVLLQDIVEDVQDAYKWIRKELSKIEPINPDLITVFGQSAGGGLALISGFKLSPRPKAIIALYPYMADFNDPLFNDHSTPPSEELLAAMTALNQSITYTEGQEHVPRFNLFLKQAYAKKQGWALVSRDPGESAESITEKLRIFSAVNYIDKDYPPTYLSHGLDDGLVLFTQSVQMAEKLKEKNIEFVLDLVEWAPHGFDFVDSSNDMWEEHILPMFDFAARFMK